MKRFVNVRIPVIFAISLILGVASGYLFIYKSISFFYFTAVVPVTAVIIILHSLFSEKHSVTVIILIIAVLFCAGAANCFFRLENYGYKQLVDGQIYTVSGTVCEKSESSDSEYVIIKNVKADNENVGGKIVVYLGETYGDFCDIGYKINFKTKVYCKDTFSYGKLNYYAQSNVKYSCYVERGLTAKYGFSFFGSMRSRIRDTVYDNLDGETAAVAYAMITGNTNGVEDETLSSFRYGGIAHIFAVSGLHIGILYGLLNALFKRIRMNKFLRAALCVLPLFLYAGICGFTLSSVRAAVMCAVTVLARLSHKKYDSLNALSLAVIIILLISPLSLFSLGLQLSLCATFAIVTLSKAISRPFKKLPRKISGAIGVSLSAQAGTMPVMLKSFGYLSGSGLLLNILVLPLLSVVYVITFVSVILISAMPFAAPLLEYAALPLQLAISFLTNAGFENSLLSGFGAGAFLPIFYLGLFVLSDKFNFKRLYRIIAVCCAVVFLCTYSLMRTFAVFSGYKIIVSANYGGGSVLIRSHEGNVLIISENISPAQTKLMLNDYYANSLSAVIILGGEDCVFSYGEFELNCKNVYVYFAYIDVQPYENCTVNYESEFSAGGVNFAFADGYSIIADCGGTEIAVCAGDYVPFESCDLLVSDVVSSGCESADCVGFNERNIEQNVYDCGNFVFSVPLVRR